MDAIKKTVKKSEVTVELLEIYPELFEDYKKKAETTLKSRVS